MDLVITAVYLEEMGVHITTAEHSTPEAAVKEAKNKIESLSEILSPHQFAVRIDFGSGVSALWDSTRKGIIIDGNTREEVIHLLESHHLHL